jgi:hypothetical protein
MERNAYFGSDWLAAQRSQPAVFYLINDRIHARKTRESGQIQFVYEPADPFRTFGGTFIGIGHRAGCSE